MAESNRAMLFYLLTFPGSAANWCERQGLEYFPLLANPKNIGVVFKSMHEAGRYMRQYHRSKPFQGKEVFA